jgi:hypothetical protein
VDKVDVAAVAVVANIVLYVLMDVDLVEPAVVVVDKVVSVVLVDLVEDLHMEFIFFRMEQVEI